MGLGSAPASAPARGSSGHGAPVKSDLSQEHRDGATNGLLWDMRIPRAGRILQNLVPTTHVSHRCAGALRTHPAGPELTQEELARQRENQASKRPKATHGGKSGANMRTPPKSKAGCMNEGSMKGQLPDV